MKSDVTFEPCFGVVWKRHKFKSLSVIDLKRQSFSQV